MKFQDIIEGLKQDKKYHRRDKMTEFCGAYWWIQFDHKYSDWNWTMPRLVCCELIGGMERVYDFVPTYADLRSEKWEEGVSSNAYLNDAKMIIEKRLVKIQKEKEEGFLRDRLDEIEKAEEKENSR